MGLPFAGDAAGSDDKNASSKNRSMIGRN